MGNTEVKEARNYTQRTSMTSSVVRNKTPISETGQLNVLPHDNISQEKETGLPNALSPNEFQRLQRYLANLLIRDGQEMETEETIAEIVSQLVIQEVGCGVDIILKGDSAKGVFLIMSGSVNVISTNGKDVLASLQEGDFFGEISVIFNTTCTATVQTATDCVLALLQLDDARRLLRKINTNVIEWFAVQRYLPTMEWIDVNRTNRRTAFKCLQNIPVFENWSEEALKSLIVQIEPALIILYPAKSPIMLENDPPNTLYIIIRGRATIMNSEDSIEINVKREPVTIGEEGMFLGTKSQVTVYAKTCCEIIQIKYGSIQSVIEQYSDEISQEWQTKCMKWRAFSDSKTILNNKYPGLLQYEVIYTCLRNSHLLTGCSGHFIQHISLQGIPQEFVVGEPVWDLSESEHEADNIVLVLKGELQLMSNHRPAITVVQGELFCPSEWMDLRTMLVAKTDCLVFKIDHDVVQEALLLYPGSALTLQENPGSTIG